MALKPENSDFPINPIFVLAIGILGVSTGAIFARLADAPALVTAAYRLGLASLILVPLAAWRARDELRNLSWQEFKLAIVSGFFLALHFATWISSLDYTAIANSVVLVNTIPLWVGLLTPLISRDRLTKSTIVSIIVSVIGGCGAAATGKRIQCPDGCCLLGNGPGISDHRALQLQLGPEMVQQQPGGHRAIGRAHRQYDHGLSDIWRGVDLAQIHRRHLYFISYLHGSFG